MSFVSLFIFPEPLFRAR